MDPSCVVVSSPYIGRGSFIYVQNFNSLVVYIMFNTYVTMSCVVFSALGNGIAEQTFATQLLLTVICVRAQIPCNRTGVLAWLVSLARV